MSKGHQMIPQLPNPCQPTSMNIAGFLFFKKHFLFLKDSWWFSSSGVGLQPVKELHPQKVLEKDKQLKILAYYDMYWQICRLVNFMGLCYKIPLKEMKAVAILPPAIIVNTGEGFLVGR